MFSGVENASASYIKLKKNGAIRVGENEIHVGSTEYLNYLKNFSFFFFLYSIVLFLIKKKKN